MAKTGARIDFECSNNISDYFPAILSEYNKIAADVPIEKGFLNSDFESNILNLLNILWILDAFYNSEGKLGNRSQKSFCNSNNSG